MAEVVQIMRPVCIWMGGGQMASPSWERQIGIVLDLCSLLEY